MLLAAQIFEATFTIYIWHSALVALNPTFVNNIVVNIDTGYSTIAQVLPNLAENGANAIFGI